MSKMQSEMGIFDSDPQDDKKIQFYFIYNIPSRFQMNPYLRTDSNK